MLYFFYSFKTSNLISFKTLIPSFFSDILGISSPKQVKRLLHKAVAELKDYCNQKSSKKDSVKEEQDEEQEQDEQEQQQPESENNIAADSSSRSHSTERFENLLLLLAPLRSLQPDVLEELFFAGLIGNVQIDSVVPYILKMEASEYKGQFGGEKLTK